MEIQVEPGDLIETADRLQCMKVLLDRGRRFSRPENIPTENRGMVTIHHNFLEVELTKNMDEWLKVLFTKICVSVDSEDALLATAKKADDARIPNALIQDSGKTEFDGVPTYTCLAIGPDDADKIDKINGELPLL